MDKVDPDYKKEIDGLDQSGLEEKYPGLKRDPYAPFNGHFGIWSETDSANATYLVNRYLELDSQNILSKHDPNFEQKRFEYIKETGIDPLTHEQVDKDTQAYAENYVTYAPWIRTAFDFTMPVIGAWNVKAYQNEVKSQKADMFDDIYKDVVDANAKNQLKGYNNRKSYYQKKVEFYNNNSTTQIDSKLVEELVKQNVKYNPNEMMVIGKDSTGKILWLETGNKKAGFEHILERHSKDFSNKGIVDIPKFLHDNISSEAIIRGEGPKGPYAIYEIDGQRYTLAYGENGFIVTFYPSK